MAARRNRPLVLVDIAVPRDIAADVQQLANVYLYDVDDLEVIVRENVRQREQELARCREIIQERTESTLARVAPAREENSGGRTQPGRRWTFGEATVCRA
jgi:glutamyl-tRNA reductase